MILILGSGLVGGSLANSLHASGVSFKIFSRTKPALSIHQHQFREGLWQDIEKHADFFYGVETLIHTISTSVPASSMQNTVQDVMDNIGANVKLLDICVRQGVKNILFISSGGAIYGVPNSDDVDETHTTNPISSYGITKLATEKYLSLYAKHYNLKTVILRPSNLYGIGQTTQKPQGVIAHIAKALQDNKPFTIWGDGAGKKDYLYIDDLIEAVTCIIKNNFNTRENVYNLSFGRCYSIREIIQAVEAYTQRTLEVRYEAAKPFDVPSISLNSNKFRTEFGWSPSISLKMGIERIFNQQ